MNYLSDEELRSTIQAATNKSESFHGITLMHLLSLCTCISR
ncbi:Tn3 family transposase [Bacillus sp. IB182487]|uniref:Tn3 family transposase n=1 Tax=Metabacillus arenae TaxID=2771434 RepID=A0A926RZW8_9BACI|nr:Tn3 family transposase [Metabacillus arenae]